MSANEPKKGPDTAMEKDSSVMTAAQALSRLQHGQLRGFLLAFDDAFTVLDVAKTAGEELPALMQRKGELEAEVDAARQARDARLAQFRAEVEQAQAITRRELDALSSELQRAQTATAEAQRIEAEARRQADEAVALRTKALAALGVNG